MTKKDYELIAGVLKDGRKIIQNDLRHHILCRNMQTKLEETNTRFDNVKFLKACGIAIE